jgi:hypothetical protein
VRGPEPVAVTLAVWWLARRSPLPAVLAGSACIVAAATLLAAG